MSDLVDRFSHNEAQFGQTLQPLKHICKQTDLAFVHQSKVPDIKQSMCQFIHEEHQILQNYQYVKMTLCEYVCTHKAFIHYANIPMQYAVDLKAVKMICVRI